MRPPTDGRFAEPGPAFERAVALFQQGRLTEALAACDAVLAAVPDHATALHLSGLVLLQQGDASAGAARIGRAVEVDPNDLDAWSNLAMAYQAAGRHDAAIDALREATRRAPRDAQLLSNMAGVLLDAGRAAEAETAARRAIDASVGAAPAWTNLALAMRARGASREALAAAQRAAALDPQAMSACGLVAELEEMLGSAGAARRTLESGLARLPGASPLRFQLAALLEREGDLESAAHRYDEVLRAEPRNGAALSQLLFLRKSLADWHDLAMLRGAFRAGVAHAQPMLSPFCLLSDPSTRAEQRRCAETWVATVAPVAGGAPRTIAAATAARLRIGYLSNDLHSHATAYLAAGVFDSHDRERFRIAAYSTGPDDGSPMRKRLARAFDTFVDARGWSAEQIAARMRADGIDILVDLKGHTEGAPTRVLALRPAPVQATWLGYPGTLGAPYVDYLIGDPTVTPLEHASDYAETLVQLPCSYQPNDRERPLNLPPPRDRLGLPDGALVLCCFNSTYKFNPELFDAWARVAGAVPDSVLWFLERRPDDPAIANLRREASSRGIAPQRLVFASRRAYPDYLGLYRHADLFLDTWPYNGHTTASDALWSGCPVVTLLGETFAGRVAASLLNAVGLPEWIAMDVDAYVERAVALGRDPARRAQLRTYLDGAGRASPLFDCLATTRALEAAYLEMAAQHRSGLRAPIRVGPGAR